MINAYKYIESKFNLNIGIGQRVVEIPETDRRTLAHLFRELDFKVGVEIGTEKGVYAKMILRRNPQLKLYCVDPWEAYSGYREHVDQDKLDFFYNVTKDRLSPYNAKLIKKYSVEASEDFDDDSLDFVYIDGNHSFKYVASDLCAWVPKVKKGGIISGHDYVKRKNPDYGMHVVEALHGYLDAYHIKPLFTLGKRIAPEGSKRDRPRSWFWVKT